jgi:hypothetical protein
MGYREAKHKVIESLNNGSFSHQERNNIDVKNVLATGDVSKETIVDILKRSSGSDYKTSKHDFDSSVDVHIVVTTMAKEKWYIKWYIVEPDCVFISVHISE